MSIGNRLRQRRPNTDRKDRKNGGEIEREIGESVATVPPRTERERERGANTPTRRERILAKSSSRHTHRAPRHCTPPSFGGETTGKALREERHSSRISIYTRNHRGGDRKREGEREIETFLARSTER